MSKKKRATFRWNSKNGNESDPLIKTLPPPSDYIYLVLFPPSHPISKSSLSRSHSLSDSLSLLSLSINQMPFISETATAIKRRFGFNDRAAAASSGAVPCTPDPSAAVSRENHAHHHSMVRRMPDLDEEAEICGGSAQITRSHSFEFNEDPAFWKDHNVQVRLDFFFLIPLRDYSVRDWFTANFFLSYRLS